MKYKLKIHIDDVVYVTKCDTIREAIKNLYRISKRYKSASYIYGYNEIKENDIPDYAMLVVDESIYLVRTIDDKLIRIR